MNRYVVLHGLMQVCWLSHMATSYSVMVSIFLCGRKVVGSTPTAKIKAMDAIQHFDLPTVDLIIVKYLINLRMLFIVFFMQIKSILMQTPQINMNIRLQRYSSVSSQNY